jgi:hypothetical protein
MDIYNANTARTINRIAALVIQAMLYAVSTLGLVAFCLSR